MSNEGGILVAHWWRWRFGLELPTWRNGDGLVVVAVMAEASRAVADGGGRQWRPTGGLTACMMGMWWPT